MYVARRMQNQGNVAHNDLEVLLSRQLESSLMNKIELSKVADFPRIKKRRLVKSIFLGSYQLRQCQSYLSDLIQHGHAYSPTINLIKQIENKELKQDLIDGKTKLLAVEITSRHRRSEYKKSEEKDEEQAPSQKKRRGPKIFKTTYKVFLEYTPMFNHYSSIKRKLKWFPTGN